MAIDFNFCKIILQQVDLMLDYTLFFPHLQLLLKAITDCTVNLLMIEMKPCMVPLSFIQFHRKYTL